MKITALIENTSCCDNVEAQHGLSLYIQLDNMKILFDMGQDELFFNNAKALNIDLANVDLAIISHGHYDHGGGLMKFLEINRKAKVYINSKAFEPYFNGEKYIGLDVSLMDNSRIVVVDNDFSINDYLTLCSCNEEKRLFDLGSFGLTKEDNGVRMDDDFDHEQYLIINENNKKVVISGCSHKGILNIANWLKSDYIIGGFHFNKLELDKKLVEYSRYLDELGAYFYTCHCTGLEQYNFMKRYMSRLDYISAGQTIEI